jgi:bifunctional ADP-heptose synthase (sugar kinase/adenylyltransferase)
MSTSLDAANAILNLIYRSVAYADIAENDSSSPATVLDIALHTAAPVTNLQTSNEAAYGGYARISINRTGTGFSAAAASALSNAALAQFAECTSGSNTITHVSVGKSGTIIHYGALSASRAVSAGIQPQFAASALVSTIS